MNREIKFKAFHKKLDAILTVYIISQQKNSDGSYVNGCRGFYGDNHQVIFSFDEVEWMQFTGVKDRNKTNIYENHFIRFSLDDEENATTTEYIEQVVYEGSGFYVDDGVPLDAVLEFGVEVIGNIHQNPNLLK